MWDACLGKEIAAGFFGRETRRKVLMKYGSWNWRNGMCKYEL